MVAASAQVPAVVVYAQLCELYCDIAALHAITRCAEVGKVCSFVTQILHKQILGEKKPARHNAGHELG